MAKIKLTDEQIMVIIDALDLYSRIPMGQFEEVLFVLRKNTKVFDYEKQEEARAALKKVRPVIGLPEHSHSYYSILSDKLHDCCRRAFMVEKVLQKYIAVKNNMDRISVWHDGPICVGLDEQLPEVTDD